jgi:3',5'-cyclic AMP phosphodiesterase CpdA
MFPGLMKFIFDPPISEKIAQMAQRVRWQDIAFRTRKIDQTQIHIDDRHQNSAEFSFLVLGDSGFGGNNSFSPQNQIAQLMLEHQDQVNFVLHTGDVVYEVGSKEYYLQNFINPYREFIIDKKDCSKIPYDQITFKIPFFLVPGNHDYYNLPLPYGIAAQAAKPLLRLMRSNHDLNLGLQGSNVGETYARAFLDHTADLTPEAFNKHLDLHYTAYFKGDRCLNYQPHRFTRLPNRYYSFRYGDIDFIALDSNTFNAPIPIADTAEGVKIREELIAQLEILNQEASQLNSAAKNLDLGNPRQQNLMNNYQAKIQQISIKQKNLHQRLQAEQFELDREQLNWFKQKLISSWLDSTVRGRIVYLHHSPYVTEATKSQLEETLEVRYQLRQVLTEVATIIGDYIQGRPLLDLVISSHAHCFEYVYTNNTEYADSKINWLICGGGGHSVHRQQSSGQAIAETSGNQIKQVAQSQLFLGCQGQGIYQKKLYSCLRIDVQAGTPPKFHVRPLVAEQAYQNWHHYQADSFVIG